MLFIPAVYYLCCVLTIKGYSILYDLFVYSQWFSVLSQVHGSTEQEIREMHDEQANPQNAVVSTVRKQSTLGDGVLITFLFKENKCLQNAAV